MFGTELIIPKTLIDYCTAREQVLVRMEEAHAIIDGCKEALEQLGPYLFPGDYDRRFSISDFRTKLDQRLWHQAFDHTGFMQLMDREAKARFMDDVERAPPPFTIENIRSTFLSVAQQADEMFARGLVNVFLRLSDRHKTNTNEPFKVNRKAILTSMAEQDWRRPTVHISYRSYASEQLNDIDRVFKILDGKKHTPRTLELACNAAFADESNPNRYSDDYYEIRGYRNGNLHITFKRQDLLDKANRIISDYYEGSALANGRKTA